MNGRGRFLILLLTGTFVAVTLAVGLLYPVAPAAGNLTPTVFVHLPAIHKQPLATSTMTATATSTSTSTATPTRTFTPTATRTSTPTATTAPAPCQCYADLYNCTDFACQGQAQTCFNYCWNLGYGDVHNLDSDGDGIACEGLPACREQRRD